MNTPSDNSLASPNAEAEEWIAEAVFLAAVMTPGLGWTQAQRVAAELHQAWPRLTPREAVSCYFAPPVDLDSTAVELI